jgi:SAM-dependent methyltransferase
MEKYHERQYGSSYESTNFILKILHESIPILPCKSTTVLDLGCGGGSNTYEMAKQFPNLNFIGIDNDKELINYAKTKNFANSRVSFKYKNIFDLKKVDVFGITAIQTVSWVPSKNIYDPIKALLSLNSEWICFSFLGFDGTCDAKIMINNFTPNNMWSKPYNILSLETITSLIANSNYAVGKVTKYNPKIEITTSESGMGSYTKKMFDGSLEIFSGPLILPWYVYFLKKI